MMNALAIAMVKNEADIIEAFVRHNLHFVDLLVVIDNHSTDGTRAILDALRAEGLPLLIFDDPIFGYYQSEKVTHVYRKVAPIYNPELVYLLDADEFIRAGSREALEGALGQLPVGGMGLLPWVTHVPPAQTDAAQLRQDPLGSMRGRRRQEEPVYYKAVIRRDAADDAQLVIEQGNHAVHRRDGRAVPAARINGAAVAHLPVRSVDQLSAKVVNGWHAYVVKNRDHEVAGMGFQWQQLYEQLLQGDPPSAAQLVDVALGYAQQPRATRNAAADIVDDPTPARYGTLKYLGLGQHGVLAKVARNMESYLADAGSAAPRAGTASAGAAEPACDIAPVLDLVRQMGTPRLACTASAQPWLPALQALLPQLARGDSAAPDLLLAPALSGEQALDLAATQPATQRVVYWPADIRGGDKLRVELDAWAARGWAPQLRQTMAYRALSSYALQRQHAIVLAPHGEDDAQRRGLVADLLCALDGMASGWVDPAAMCIRHPMQDLVLAAA